MSTETELLPIFLKLNQKNVLVVGGGSVAREKIKTLLTTGANITVISPQTKPEIDAWEQAGCLVVLRREVRESDLDGKFLVYVATGVPEVNQRLWEYAKQHNILLNTVDNPPLCDFYSAAVVKRGPWRVAISTQGNFAGLAQALQQVLSAIIPEESLADWDELLSWRKKLATYLKTQPQRTAYLRKLLRKIKKKVL